MLVQLLFGDQASLQGSALNCNKMKITLGFVSLSTMARVKTEGVSFPIKELVKVLSLLLKKLNELTSNCLILNDLLKMGLTEECNNICKHNSTYKYLFFSIVRSCYSFFEFKKLQVY